MARSHVQLLPFVFSLSPLRRVTSLATLFLGLNMAKTHAATFTVSNPRDSGAGSLRQAVSDANSAIGDDTIVFSLSGSTPKVIHLTSGEMTIPQESHITISGPETSRLTLSGDDISRIFFIRAGGNLSLNHLDLIGGYTPGFNFSSNNGAAIYNVGTLSLNDCLFSENHAPNGGGGGAIYNINGTLTINNSSFSNNSAEAKEFEITSGGGVICSQADGGRSHVTINRSTFTNNRNNYGGVILNAENCSLTINECVFSGNSTYSQSSDFKGLGGVLWNSGGGVAVNRSTFLNNKSGNGGAIFNSGANISIRNCTFTGNEANDAGGAIDITTSSDRGSIVNIDSSTISGNSCTGSAAISKGEGSTLSLKNSIVAGNSGAATSPNILGVVAAGDYNLVDDAAGATLAGDHNIIGQNPKLGPLQNNGGASPTMALLPDSPALDAGSTNLTTDQRGVKRPQHIADDIGAFEVQSAPPTPALPGISVNSPSVREGTGAPSQLVFTLALSKASQHPVTVIVQSASASTASASATAKTDYVPIGKTRVTFAPGQTRQTVNVSVVGDTLDEDSERVALVLSAPTGATLGTATGEGTIVDDDATPAIFVNDVSVKEGDASYSKATFTLALSNPSSRTISVGYSTYSSGRGAATGGTASTPGADYLAGNGTLSFAPGQTTKTVTILIKGDSLVEADETFLVRLFAPVNARLADGTGVGTIQNDDKANPASSDSAPTSSAPTS